jgi:hypothetical protein
MKGYSAFTWLVERIVFCYKTLTHMRIPGPNAGRWPFMTAWRHCAMFSHIIGN